MPLAHGGVGAARLLTHALRTERPRRRANVRCDSLFRADVQLDALRDKRAHAVLELTGIELKSAAHANAKSALSEIHRAAALGAANGDLIAVPPGYPGA